MILNKDTPKLLYSYQTGGIIWKIALDDAQQIIAWENRSENKQVSFYAYDFKNNKQLLANYIFEEKWLLALSKVFNGILYLNGFESEFSPINKGIIAYHLADKKILWQNFSVSIQEFTSEGIVVFNPKSFPKKFQLLDLESGKSIRNLDYEMLKLIPNIQNNLFLPNFFNGVTNWEDYYLLIINGLEIKSFYEKTKDAYNHCLEIKKGREIIFSKILDLNIQKMSFDSFFVWQQKLIYIKNKSEIVSYLV